MLVVCLVCSPCPFLFVLLCLARCLARLVSLLCLLALALACSLCFGFSFGLLVLFCCPCLVALARLGFPLCFVVLLPCCPCPVPLVSLPWLARLGLPCCSCLVWSLVAFLCSPACSFGLLFLGGRLLCRLAGLALLFLFCWSLGSWLSLLILPLFLFALPLFFLGAFLRLLALARPLARSLVLSLGRLLCSSCCSLVLSLCCSLAFSFPFLGLLVLVLACTRSPVLLVLPFLSRPWL